MFSQPNIANPQANRISIGVSIWLVLGVAAALDWVRLGLIELLFLFAVWVIVPGGTELLPAVDRSPLRIRFLQPSWPSLLAAAMTTGSFVLPAGRLAGMLATCWFLICGVFTSDGAMRFWNYRFNSFSQMCFTLGEAYLAVGGAWLVMSRLGMQPVGFVEPIVLLTAVHFHFAGFLSCVFAGLIFDRLRGTAWSNPLRIVLLGVISGPGLLGLAFLIGPKLKLIAAMIVAIGQIGMAVATVRIAVTDGQGLPKFLLIASALSVAIGMAFAAIWALGEYPLQPMTDLSQMAHIHGVLNALGFGFCGLIGWKGIQAADL